MKKTIFAALVAMSAAFATQAATLYTNTFDTSPTLATNLSGGSLSGGGLVTSGTTTNGTTVYGSALNAVTFDKDYTFSLTLATGFKFVLSSISFDYRETTTSAANFTFSVNGNSFATSTLTKDSTYHSSGTLPGTFSITSTGTPQVINFDLGFAGGSTASGTVRIDNVIMIGTITAVPEPHEYGIGLAALLGALVVIRRRKTAVMS